MSSTLHKSGYMYSMATLISRECNQFLESLNNSDDDIPYIVKQYANPSMLERYGDNEIYLLEMLKITEDDGSLKLNLTVDSTLISYCKLFNIPHQLTGLDRTYHNSLSKQYITSEFQCLNLDSDDIDNLDDESKKWLHDYCIKNNDQHYYNLLYDSNYLMNGEVNITYRRMRMMKRFKWIPRIKRMIFDTYRSEYKSSLTVLRMPEFDSVWRSLSYQEIISDEFDIDHLSRIGVQVPHINLILDKIRKKNDISQRDLYLAKKLAPYSSPSQENIDDLLDRCCIKHSHEVRGCTTLQAVEIVMELVRHNQISLRDYMEVHPLIYHLHRVFGRR